MISCLPITVRRSKGKQSHPSGTVAAVLRKKKHTLVSVTKCREWRREVDMFIAVSLMVRMRVVGCGGDGDGGKEKTTTTSRRMHSRHDPHAGRPSGFMT